jgi:hypothetical protein
LVSILYDCSDVAVGRITPIALSVNAGGVVSSADRCLACASRVSFSTSSTIEITPPPLAGHANCDGLTFAAVCDDGVHVGTLRLRPAASQAVSGNGRFPGSFVGAIVVCSPGLLVAVTGATAG